MFIYSAPLPGGPDDFVEEDLPEPVSRVTSRNNRLPLQDTQVPPLVKTGSSDSLNRKNSNVSIDSQTSKKQDSKQIETIKTQRSNPDLSKETENRVLLSKSPSLKHVERPSALPKREGSEHSVSAVSRVAGRKTRNAALKPQGGGVTTPTSSPRKGRREEGWKEVGRR